MVPVTIQSSDGDMLIEPRCVRHVSLDRVCRPTPRFPPQGPPGRVPLLPRYYQSATTPYRPSRRTSFPSLGGTSVALVAFAPRRTSALPRPGVGYPVSPAGNLPRRREGSPKFLENPNCPFAHVPIRLRQDCSHQTITVQQRGPWYFKSEGSHERCTVESQVTSDVMTSTCWEFMFLASFTFLVTASSSRSR